MGKNDPQPPQTEAKKPEIEVTGDAKIFLAGEKSVDTTYARMMPHGVYFLKEVKQDDNRYVKKLVLIPWHLVNAVHFDIKDAVDKKSDEDYLG